MPIEIYVAGSARNWQRARAFMERIHAHEHMRVVFDWTLSVEAAQSAGVHDSALDNDERASHARADLNAIESCDVFVLLAESEPVGRGAWIELGYAMRIRDANVRRVADSWLDGEPTIVVSGGDRRSIFTTPPALVDYEVPYDVGTHDDEAFSILEDVARDHIAEVVVPI